MAPAVIALLKRAEPITSSQRTLIIVATVLGTAVLALIATIIFIILRRRRNKRRDYELARLRDPSLTWEEHHRRLNLSQSQIAMENELRRVSMIRKSLQSRTSSSLNSPVPKPTHTRSRTWHGESVSQTDNDGDEGAAAGVRPAGRDDWKDYEAGVEGGGWPLTNVATSPSPLGDIPAQTPLEGGREGGDTHARGPIVRLKTPPLLSHPAFRRMGSLRLSVSRQN